MNSMWRRRENPAAFPRKVLNHSDDIMLCFRIINPTAQRNYVGCYQQTFWSLQKPHRGFSDLGYIRDAHWVEHNAASQLLIPKVRQVNFPILDCVSVHGCTTRCYKCCCKLQLDRQILWQVLLICAVLCWTARCCYLRRRFSIWQSSPLHPIFLYSKHKGNSEMVCCW